MIEILGEQAEPRRRRIQAWTVILERLLVFRAWRRCPTRRPQALQVCIPGRNIEFAPHLIAPRQMRRAGDLRGRFSTNRRVQLDPPLTCQPSRRRWS